MAFLVIFAVNGVFIYKATRTHTGLVTQQAYEKGLDYDTIVENARTQDALGWQSTITLHDHQLSFTLQDASGDPVSCEQANAYLMRPTQSQLDFLQPLTQHEDGSYQSRLAMPQSGQWDITVSVLCNKQSYQKRQRVIVK